MRSPTRPAADEIGMRCKPLFYFSRRPLVAGRWQRTQPGPSNNDKHVGPDAPVRARAKLAST
jgi:hypothetical protein